MSAGEPTAWILLKKYFLGMYTASNASSGGANSTLINSTAENTLGNRNPSLLSDVTFLNWFNSPALNRIVLDVLEGQIITLLVVIAFILIFLIREWVVQQQPVINMAAMDENHARGQVAEVHDHDHDEMALAEEAAEAGEWEDQVEPEQDVLETDDGEAGGGATRELALLAPEPEQGRNEEGARARLRRRRPTPPPPANTRRTSSTGRTWDGDWGSSESSENLPENIQHALRTGTATEVANLVERLPPDESNRVREALVKLSDEMRRNAESGSSDEESRSSKKRKRSSRADRTSVQTQSEQMDSGVNSPVRDEEPPNVFRHLLPDYVEPSSSQQRPNMPIGERSFLVTEIRRSLEEGETWNPPLDQTPPEASNSNQPHQEGQQPHDLALLRQNEEDDEALDTQQLYQVPILEPEAEEHGSDHSSESWQQVPAIVVDQHGEASTDQLSSKGKQKAEEPADDNHEAAESSPAASSVHVTPATSEAGSMEVNYGDEPAEPSETVADFESLDLSDSSESVIFPDDDGEDLEPLIVAEPEPAREVIPHQPGLMDRVVEWLWGDVAPATQGNAEDVGNDEHVVQNLADEAPFVPFAGQAAARDHGAPRQDPEVAAAAAQAGIDLNDQDAIDDAEDLEGILELIGMQGPLTGLFQNAMFSAVLISATLACAVWLPYLWGKVVLLFMGSPIALFVKLPLQFVAAFADLAVDAALCCGALLVYWSIEGLRYPMRWLTFGLFSSTLSKPADFIARPAHAVAENAMDRISNALADSRAFTIPDYFHLSINSHVALRTIQNTMSEVFNTTGNAIVSLFDNVSTAKADGAVFDVLHQVPVVIYSVTSVAFNKTRDVMSYLWKSKSYKITFGIRQNVTSSAYTTIEQWTATDRMIAIFAGYMCFAMAGALYLKRSTPFSSSQQGRKVEGVVADVLQQAGGVLKVILIISIEMIAFPLYCGLLLDAALLPLFEKATVYSRYQFTITSPWTSGFVHWFVGTCYMFHFALFVSMCRKIMRSGVLYFIRDPDDPTFHPVRDVLERNVTTQLRKIAFSALVYGALVIICLGGVVWGLNIAFTGVLPIHWSSHTPALEFPLDLLFYNFLTPLVLRLVKPNEGLHAIYQWWFKSCARLLRLSDFLFAEKNPDEQGHHVRRTWKSWFFGTKGNVQKPVIGDDRKLLVEDRDTDVYFLFDGKYVRAPASDQVRIPKGDPVFVEVDRFNRRADGQPEEGGVHASTSDMIAMVYIPPWFRVRIALFVLTIWLFAAATGVGITILPLLFGRYLFSFFIPPFVRMNDIYAFSLGIYTLGSLLYAALHIRLLLSTLHQPLRSPLTTLTHLATTTSRVALRIARIAYVYTALVVLLPILFALLLELYILIPLHAYLGPHEPHVVHLIQDWTLGFLYARLAARLVFSNRNSRPARAFAAVVRGGYGDPDARLATRCFILPVLVGFAVVVAMPSALAWGLNRTVWAGASEEVKRLVWRFCYPGVAGVGGGTWVAREIVGVVRRWRLLVRDEVYLIGERLHNFGERKAGPRAEVAAM
jgi:E3 ubiquitin-protein ligase MARCH6